MNTELIHTPEGVRDIYGDEYAKKLAVQNMLHKQIHLYGYQDIQTPTFEYFDVFGKEIGTTPAKDLFKFFDSDGNILCLRPDFTPSMARCAAKYFVEEDLPLRLSYVGNTFSNTSLLQGKLKETTQMGAELMGDGSVEADGEMIAMLVDALLQTGLNQFQVSVGEIDYFKGICEELSLTSNQEMVIRDYISNKNFFAVKEYLQSEKIEKEQIDTIMAIEDLFGNVEVLKEAEKLSKPVLFMAGTKDKVVDADKWLVTAYNAVKGPAVYASLNGAIHTTCCSDPTAYSRYAISWFNAWFYNDNNHKDMFKDGGELSTDTNWSGFMCKGF